jgi:DNA polymerase/3'-5' exonuclease PolX
VENGMAHTYEELKKKTIAELREIAKDIQHEAVQGYTQLNKEHLLPALCKALGIDSHAHHAAAIAEKAAVKAKMRDLNAAKVTALESGDHERVRQIRRQYHHLNHSLRTAAKRATSH